MDKPKTKKPPFSTRLIPFVSAAVLLTLLFSLLGSLGKLCWVFNLFSHFRLQYIACLLAAALFFFFLRRLKLSLLCAAGGLTLFLPLAHYYIPHAKVAHFAPFKVISFNVNWCNKNTADIREFLSLENADVVLLIEANPHLAGELQALHSLYPYRLEKLHETNKGMIVLSKHPFLYAGVHSGENMPYADFAVTIGTENYHFVGVHTFSPVSASRAEARNTELLALARAQRANPRDNVILMGDFNLTPFSPWYAEVLRTSGLRDSLSGFGLSPTWMTGTILLALPLDQLLLSPSLAVLRRTVGANCGSDHNPLIVELARKSGEKRFAATDSLTIRARRQRYYLAIPLAAFNVHARLRPRRKSNGHSETTPRREAIFHGEKYHISMATFIAKMRSLTWASAEISISPASAPLLTRPNWKDD